MYAEERQEQAWKDRVAASQHTPSVSPQVSAATAAAGRRSTETEPAAR